MVAAAVLLLLHTPPVVVAPSVVVQLSHMVSDPPIAPAELFTVTTAVTRHVADIP